LFDFSNEGLLQKEKQDDHTIAAVQRHDTTQPRMVHFQVNEHLDYIPSYLAAGFTRIPVLYHS